MNYLLLLSGIILLLLVLSDFYYTTLSCNGSGFITHHINWTLARWWLPAGNSTFKQWTGLLHLLITLMIWISTIILAAYLINLSHPEMVIKSKNGQAADSLERLYFSIYTYSTWGNGDLSPGNDFSRIFHGLFSIIGFGMLTIGITYLLSVINAALEKKQLASIISGMGDNPFALYRYFTIKEEAAVFLEKIDDLILLLQKHSNNHLSYPIVHFFLTSERSKAVSLHITSLYEVSYILRARFAGHHYIDAELHRLQKHLQNYLQLSLPAKIESKFDPQRLQYLRKSWGEYYEGYQGHHLDQPERGRQLGALLHSQGWCWEDVYAT